MQQDRTSASPLTLKRPILCAGAVHWDLTVHASQPIKPDTSTPGKLSQGPGGVATNVARALRRLGAPVHLAGAIGDDLSGKALTALLETEGVASSLVTVANATTGTYVALHDPDGSLPAACIDDRLLANVPPKTFADALEASQTDGLLDICFMDANLTSDQALAMIDVVSPETLVAADAVSAAKANRLAPLLTSIDLLFLNRAEASALTGLSGDETACDLISALHERGAPAVVMTDGPDGLWICEPGAQPQHLESSSSDIVDVTGAGDATIAGILAGLTRGLPLSDAAPCGLAAAALALQTRGATPNLSWAAIAPETTEPERPLP